MWIRAAPHFVYINSKSVLPSTHHPLSDWFLLLFFTEAIGLPLQFWTEKMFKAIGNQCGGWLETEEETSLKNHLKWVRMRTKGFGKEVPKEVKIVNNGLTFLIPIWSKLRTMVVARAEEVPQDKYRWAKKTLHS